MRPSRAAAVCGLGATALAVAIPALGALARPGYRSCAQYISELGESGARHAALVNYAGFLPVGLLTILFGALAAVALRSNRRAAAGLLAFTGVGWAYVIAAFFPCDLGCPTTGSATQQIHSAFGLVEYLGGGTGILLAGLSPPVARRSRHLAPLSIACATVVFATFVGMLVSVLAGSRGLIQRAGEAALFLWVLALAATLWRGSGHGDDST